MKKMIIGIIILFVVALLIPFRASAVGGFSVSTEEINLHPGGTASFSVTASNSAGKINLLSNNTNVVSINANSIFLDQDSEEITVTAVSVGSTSILVSATSNFATYDEEILEGQSRQILVNVTEAPQPSDDPQNGETVIDQNEQNVIDTQNNTADTPDTGNNSQKNDGSTPIILSSVIGASLAAVLFTIFYLHRRSKAHQA